MLSIRLCCFLLPICLITSSAHALGNHPESGACPEDKPYFTFCSHSFHSLEGWVGDCHATREAAQKDADKHAADEHDGNSRWTGVLKARFGSQYSP